MKKFFLLFFLFCNFIFPNNQIKNLVKTGLNYAYNFQIEKAFDIFDDIIKKYPKEPEGYHYKSTIYLWFYLSNNETQNFNNFMSLSDQAIELANQKIKDEKDIEDSKFILGLNYGFRGMTFGKAERYLEMIWAFKESYANLEDIIKLNPNNYDAYLGLGLFKFTLDQIPPAFQWALDVIGFEGDISTGLNYLKTAAEKLTKKNERFGFSMLTYGWFFEQLLAVSGGYYVNNGNGRDALATEATFNSPEGVAVLEWWKGMYDEGIMGNYGRANADVRTAFYAEQTAMFVDSTAVLRGAMDTVAGKFEIGTANLPRPNEEAFDTSGTIIGGGSLWMISDRPQEELDCAWEFIKFQSSPDQQAYWHTMSGYFPIRKTAYDVTLAKGWRAKYPQFETAVNQLHLAPNNRVTQGGLIGVFPTARQTIEAAIEEVLAGVATPQEALDKAAQIVTDAIVEYNISMGLD